MAGPQPLAWCSARKYAPHQTIAPHTSGQAVEPGRVTLMAAARLNLLSPLFEPGRDAGRVMLAADLGLILGAHPLETITERQRSWMRPRTMPPCADQAHDRTAAPSVTSLGYILFGRKLRPHIPVREQPGCWPIDISAVIPSRSSDCSSPVSRT
jgi:hypothetical protein